jgi:anti-sigma regulatory factor (Ser/Thr protein kinase)
MSVAHGQGTGQHRALLYDEPGAFVGGVGAFLRGGLREGDHVVAVVTPEKLGWLRDELGGDASAIELLEAGSFYDRHGLMFSGMSNLLERHAAPGRGRVRIVAEQALANREPADVRAYMRYEAASNVLYGQYDVSVLCPYDAAGLPDGIIDAALRTHPTIAEDGGDIRDSASFTDPGEFVRQHVLRRPPPSVSAAGRLERAGDVAAARRWVAAHASAAGLSAESAEDLVLAVSEVATNALIHGEAPRLLWSYLEDGHLVCQIRDGGPGPVDPLAGYLPPDQRLLGGRGLWIAHQVCDIVEVASDTSHTDVYVRMRLPVT